MRLTPIVAALVLAVNATQVEKPAKEPTKSEKNRAAITHYMHRKQMAHNKDYPEPVSPSSESETDDFVQQDEDEDFEMAQVDADPESSSSSSSKDKSSSSSSSSSSSKK